MRKQIYIPIPQHLLGDFEAAQKKGITRTYEREHAPFLIAEWSYDIESKDGHIYRGKHRFILKNHNVEVSFSYDSQENVWRMTSDFND